MGETCEITRGANGTGFAPTPGMKRLLAILIVAGLAIPSAGCIVQTRPSRHSRASKAKCAPSHYWDGAKCRHKGKGRGARKHDY